MRPPFTALAVAACALALLGAVTLAGGTGVKVYAPSELSIVMETLPLEYGGSFFVLNDGFQERVYVVRVAVDDPAAIAWIDVSPPGFVLAPGEARLVNFTVRIGKDQAKPGVYHVIFMPTLLPLNVEPYIDTFASYVLIVDRFNFTVDVSADLVIAALGYTPSRTPVSFDQGRDRVNLVQYARPAGDNRMVTEIDRAVRINVPSVATAGEPVAVTLSVFQDLSSRGIDLMAISPQGDFYPIPGENFTFDQTGRWGIVALAGDEVLLGRPVDVGRGGVQLVMPGLDTILASLSLLLLLSIVPIWLMGRPVQVKDPYEDVAYKAHIVKKYIDQFDPERLTRAIDMLVLEYDSLVAREARGDRERARASIEELSTLARLQQ